MRGERVQQRMIVVQADEGGDTDLAVGSGPIFHNYTLLPAIGKPVCEQLGMGPDQEIRDQPARIGLGTAAQVRAEHLARQNRAALRRRCEVDFPVGEEFFNLGAPSRKRGRDLGEHALPDHQASLLGRPAKRSFRRSAVAGIGGQHVEDDARVNRGSHRESGAGTHPQSQRREDDHARAIS